MLVVSIGRKSMDRDENLITGVWRNGMFVVGFRADNFPGTFVLGQAESISLALQMAAKTASEIEVHNAVPD